LSIFEFLAATFLAGAFLRELVKRMTILKIKKNERRQRLIQDAKYLIGKISNMGYENLGDFRDEQIFIDIFQYLSGSLQHDIEGLVIHSKVSKDDSAQLSSEKEKFQSCMSKIKQEIASLEKKWLIS